MNKLFPFTIFAVLAMFWPFMANAEVYFQDGMKWTMRVYSSTTPEGVSAIETVMLDGVTETDGCKVAKLYASSDLSDCEPTLVALVRTEGERVYFRSSSDSDEWYLMYDFGLNPGEGCYVYTINGTWDYPSAPIRSYVKCVGTVDDGDYCGWEAMSLEQYDSDVCEMLVGKGIWLKGLCSTAGVINNSLFEADGRKSVLWEASCGAKILYSAGSASVAAPVQDELHVTVEGRIVSVAGCAESVGLYSVGGMEIAPRRTTAGMITFEAPDGGVYILRDGASARKIAVH